MSFKTKNPAARKAFGALLVVKRKAAGLTQADASKKLGYTSPQFISNMERGITVIPSRTLAKLADAYNVPRRTLLGRYGDLIAGEYVQHGLKARRKSLALAIVKAG